MPDWIVNENKAGVTIAVQVVPRASRNQIVGLQAGALKVRIVAPPVEGAANEALIAFLASVLGVRRREISLISGGHSRRKLLRIEGINAEKAIAQLWPGDDAAQQS